MVDSHVAVAAIDAIRDFVDGTSPRSMRVVGIVAALAVVALRYTALPVAVAIALAMN